jgi:hypothetical protein
MTDQVCDAREEIMRKALIESYVNQLRASFGKVRLPIEEEKLRFLYDEREYGAMVHHIKTILCLSMPIRLGLVNKGGPNAPAWIERPPYMFLFGAWLSQRRTVTMYLRKTFLAESGFEQVVLAIAHELSHLVLYGTGHTLRDQEEAVDLTAMLLGFRDFYVTGCRISSRYQVSVVGYLTPEEVGYAAEYMTYG